MTRILLIHQKQIQHYRVAIYNYLSSYLKKQGFELCIVAEGIEAGNPFNVEFKYDCITQKNYLNLKHRILDRRAQIVILFVNLRHLYLSVKTTAYGCGGVWGQRPHTFGETVLPLSQYQ
jgi:hypothetical protein